MLLFLVLNVSFDASLTIYTNKTIIPPIKIKNKIKDIHVLEILIHKNTVIIALWIMITISSITGWVAVTNITESLIIIKFIIIQDLVYWKY